MNGFRIWLTVLCLPVILAGQNYPKKEAIDYSDLIKKFPTQAAAEREKYQSPDMQSDSIALIRQYDSLSGGQHRLPASSGVQMFGYNLFAKGGTTLEIPQSLAVPDDYRLGPGDNITVNLWGRVEQDYDLMVDREGTVFIPKIGQVPLWGLTLRQAEKRIRDKLQTVFSEFQLSVTLGKLKSIQVFVFGEVRYPGSYSVNSLSTMFSALYSAGGPTDKGSLRKIRLLRAGLQTATVDLYQFLLFGKNVAGVSLQAGDVIFVDVVGKRVKVSGAVKRPAIYEVTGHETITEIIDLAGGTLPSAYMDKIRIDRVTSNDSYKVIDLNLKDSLAVAKQYAIEDGDEVIVESIYDAKQNVIFLEGSFRHPGFYQYRDGLTIADLFKDGCDLEVKAYRGRIDILRNEKGYDTSLVSLNPEDVLAGRSDVALHAGDRLIAYTQEEVVPRKQVSIYGMVTKPGEYPFYEGMHISDLVFHAGNLTPSAYSVRVELARIKNDGKKEVLYASLNDPQQDLTLQGNDKVFVRQMPGWEERDMVTIDGAVKFPGRYVITDQMNTLYSLLERAGGLTDEAFPTGTVFNRATIVSDLKRRGVDELINRSIVKSFHDSVSARNDSASMLRDNNMSNRIVVSVEELLDHKGGKFDVKLADGDHIYVPQKPAGIQVLGAVPSVSTITFQPGKRSKYYLRQAGGFLQSANTGKVQLIRADGTIISGRAASIKKVKMGDAIFVPTKMEKDHDWWRVATSIMSIVTSVATTIFVINKL